MELFHSLAKLAFLYFQLSTWVAATIVTEKSVEKRANMFINFIETAKVGIVMHNLGLNERKRHPNLRTPRNAERRPHSSIPHP